MEPDSDMLARYGQGKCTDEETRAVMAWLLAGEPDATYETGADLDRDRLKDELWAPVEAAMLTDRSKSALVRWFTGPARAILAAASVCLALLLGAMLLRNSRPDIFMTTFRTATTENIDVTYRELAAQRGQKLSLYLADGSLVELNAGSRIRYPEQFGDSLRQVFLEGEAFFTVTKDPKRRFVVETRRTATRVLGTRFNVSDFDNAPASVTVEEGRVAFTGKGGSDTLFLSMNEQAALNAGDWEKQQVRPGASTEWRTDVLSLRDISLNEAIPVIERWYDVTIRVDRSSLREAKIKGSFSRMPVSKMMDELSYLLNARYRIEGNQILIY